MSMIEAIESIGIPKSDVLCLVNMDSEKRIRKNNTTKEYEAKSRDIRTSHKN